MIVNSQQSGSEWVARALRDDEFNRVTPLLQISGEDIHIEEWCRDLRKSGACTDMPGGGVAIIEDEKGYIFSAFCFRTRPSAGGRILTIGRMIMPDTVMAFLLPRLVSILDRFARDQNCFEVEILPEAADEGSPLRPLLTESFHYYPAHWGRKVSAAGN